MQDSLPDTIAAFWMIFFLVGRTKHRMHLSALVLRIQTSLRQGWGLSDKLRQSPYFERQHETWEMIDAFQFSESSAHARSHKRADLKISAVKSFGIT